MSTLIHTKGVRVTKGLAALAMVGSAACWGSATVMSRDLLDHFSAPRLLIIQLGSSILLLALMALREQPRLFLTPALGKASLTGILEPGLAYTAGLIGLSMTTAGHSAVISSAEPIFIVLVGWLLFRHRSSLRTTVCIALAMVGLLLVSLETVSEHDGHNMLLGDTLVVLATLFAAGYVVLSARIAGHFPPAILAGAQQTVGFGFAVLVYMIAQSIGVSPPQEPIDISLLVYAAFSGIIQYAIPFWLYLIGLQVLSASVAGLYLTLTPKFGIVGAYLWLGEQASGTMLLGAGIIITAVLIGRNEH